MKSSFFVILAILGTLVTLTSCGPATPTIPTVDSAKEPMKAYAAEIKYQYDIIAMGLKKGSLGDKDIAAYLASWDRVAGFFPEAAKLDQKMTDQEKAAYLGSEFKYPWFSGGNFQDDGTLESQNGFYGSAIAKKSGKLVADWNVSSGALSVPIDSFDPEGAQVLGFLMSLSNAVLVDLDKVVAPDKKKELGREIIFKLVACYPSLKYPEGKLMQTLQGAAGFGLMANMPTLKAWLGF